MQMKSRCLTFFLLAILLAAMNGIQAQPWHTQVLYHDFLDNPNSTALGTMKNTGGVFVAGKGWQTISNLNQLFITLPANLPLEGSLEIDVTNFDPWYQNDAIDNDKQHCINLWSRPEADKSVYETNASWINVRTQRHDRYSAGDGLIGFKFLTQPRGIDSRHENYLMRDMDWDPAVTYTFRIIWTTEKAYIYVEGILRATFPFSGQIEPFRYIFLGKDNLIYGYRCMVGPRYSNLTIYGPDGSVPPPPPPPDPPPPPPVGKNLFADITASADAGGFSAVGYGQGLSFSDVDADGYVDLFVSNGSSYGPLPDLLYINKGNNTFSQETDQRGTSNSGLTKAIVSADFDADGHLDAFFANVPLSAGDPGGANTLYFNDGEGGFTDASASSGISQIPLTTNGSMALDADRDGDLDLFTVNVGTFNEFYLNDGTGHFTLTPSGAEGQVENTSHFGRQGATAADIDNDGDMDIYVCRRQESTLAAPNWLFINDGKGHFIEDAAARHADIGGRSSGATFADIDNDGDMDLFVINYAMSNTSIPQLTMLLNDGTGHFADRTSSLNVKVSGYTVFLGDVDNDADLDLFVPRNNEKEAGTKPQLYLNNGSGGFSLMNDSGVDVASNDFRGGAFADIDNDGDLDAYITSAKSQNYLFRNDSRAGNHYLKVLCIGPRGEYGGIGSKVTLYSAGHCGDSDAIIGHQEVSSQHGYMSQNPATLHFGLGARTLCDLRVIFTTGDTLNVHQVGADQLYVARHAIHRFRLNKSAGDGQDMNPGIEFPMPFAVSVLDENSTAMSGIPVLFSVMAGSGHLSGEVIRQVVTNTDGVASVRWTAGPYWGPENILQATVIQGGREIEGAPVRWSFAAPSVDPDSSTLTATSPVQADGLAASQITVTLKTPTGLPSGPGFTVKLSALGEAAQLVQTDTLTDQAGQVHASLSALSAGERNIYALVKGLELALHDTAVVNFETSQPNRRPQILSYDPAEPYVLGYYDQSLNFSLNSVVDEDGDSLRYRWLVNGEEKSTRPDMSFVPAVATGKEYEVIAWVNDGQDSTFIQWHVAVTLTGLCEGRESLPKALQLRQNYPNPFNPTTQIMVEVPAVSRISVCIYNVQGQRVRNLCDAVLSPGYHAMHWDARNDAGHPLPSGIYHAVLLAEGQRQIIRLLLMK